MPVMDDMPMDAMPVMDEIATGEMPAMESMPTSDVPADGFLEMPAESGEPVSAGADRP
jgi:hypothetical protein